MANFRLPTSQFPQANVLADVVRTVEVIATGASTFQEMADYIDKDVRQGRYYRLAAELLGFVANSKNSAVLTERGKNFAATTGQEREQLLAQAVLSTQLIQRMLPLFEEHQEGISLQQIEEFLTNVTQTTPNMVERRTSTVLSWLRKTRLVTKQGDKYHFNASTALTLGPLEFQNDSEPLLPRSADLQTYKIVKQRARRAAGVINAIRDQVKVERANVAHTHLVNLVSQYVRRSGSIPRYNQLIDLAARVEDIDFIVEMKSIGERNVRSQIRRGLSQLYEYRYL